jgi:quercetin dioxygenase-like cupin family protein
MSSARRVRALDADARRDGDPIDSFLAACARRLTELTTEPPAADGAVAFARAVDQSRPLVFQPGWLPALDTLAEVDDTPLARQFVEVAPLLAWQPTFRTDDRGADIALAPLDEVRHLAGLTVGVMYIRPGCTYPLHSHPPHELYLTLAGNGDWRYGGDDGVRRVPADAVIYNHPGDLHSAVAGDTPLVALYVLWE